MTFKEFIDEARATSNPFIDKIEGDILARLRQEGFTDNQVSGMAMSKLCIFYSDATMNFVDEIIAETSKTLAANPNLKNDPALQVAIKELKMSVNNLRQ